MSKEQIRLLKQINKCGLFDPSNMSANEREILFHLSRQKFITTCANPNGERPLYKITELGKAELFSLRQNSLKFWLPTIISLVALIKSFFPQLLLLLKSVVQLLK